MREGIGHDIALASPLQAVIADRGRRLHGRLDVAGPTNGNSQPAMIAPMIPAAMLPTGPKP